MSFMKFNVCSEQVIAVCYELQLLGFHYLLCKKFFSKMNDNINRRMIISQFNCICECLSCSLVQFRGLQLRDKLI